MKLNQFAVYRVDQQTAGKALWHLPYQEARQQNVSITVENYRVISIHEMQEEEKVADIWKRMRIAELCRKRGYTKYRLAQLTGITQTALGNMLNQKSMPTMANLEKICILYA